MSFERSVGPGAEPAPTPGLAGAEVTPDGGVTPAMRLQILSTEHWSLLASRSLAWNESFSRAGMFLSTLSGSIVALALVAQATEFGEGFRIFGLVILPVVLLIGIGTVLRMGIANYHDGICVIGMNRIRAGYLEIAPDLQRYFVMGTTDDDRGIRMTMAIQNQTPVLVQLLASSPMLISVLNAILVGAIVSFTTLQAGGNGALAVILGGVGFLAALGAALAYAGGQIARMSGEHRPMFSTPSPPAPEDHD